MLIGHLEQGLRASSLAAILSLGCFGGTACAADATTYFDYASLVGSGQTIAVTQLPTVDSTGHVSYYDVTIGFTVNADGTLNPAPTVVITPSPILQTDNFKAGLYTTTTGSGPVQVTGPGAGTGGQTIWSLLATTTACTDPPSATWYTGPIAQTPIAARLKKAGINQKLYKKFSFGLVGSGSACDGYHWLNNYLMAAQQVNGNLVLYSFTDHTGDYSSPQAQITYRPEN